MENRNNIICTTNTSNEQHGWVGEDSTHYGPGLVATAETSISRVYVSNIATCPDLSISACRKQQIRQPQQYPPSVQHFIHIAYHTLDRQYLFLLN